MWGNCCYKVAVQAVLHNAGVGKKRKFPEMAFTNRDSEQVAGNDSSHLKMLGRS